MNRSMQTGVKFSHLHGVPVLCIDDTPPPYTFLYLKIQPWRYRPTSLLSFHFCQTCNLKDKRTTTVTQWFVNIFIESFRKEKKRKERQFKGSKGTFSRIQKILLGQEDWELSNAQIGHFCYMLLLKTANSTKYLILSLKLIFKFQYFQFHHKSKSTLSDVQVAGKRHRDASRRQFPWCARRLNKKDT